MLVLVSLFLLVPKVAWAAGDTASQPTVLQTFMDQFFAIVLPALTVIVGALVTAILTKLKNRFHLDVSQSTMDAWSQLASSAAMRGAEWARQKAKTLVGDKKVPGEEVMEVAVNWATQMAEAHKLPELAREKLVGLIEAELYKLRLTTTDPAPATATATATAGTDSAAPAAATVTVTTATSAPAV